MDYHGKRMVNRYEYVDLFSPGEYRRRIDGIRQVMREHGVQTLIFLECAEEAYDTWLLGRRFLEYIIVPEKGDVIGVLWNELDEPERTGEPDWGNYILQKEDPPVCEGIRFIGRVPDRQIAGLVGAERPERIGLVLPQQLTAELSDALDELLPHAERLDLSIPTAVFRAVKSEEERFAIRQARNIQAKVFYALPQIVREGRDMRDISEEISYLIRSLGGAGVVHAHLICDGPMDMPSGGPKALQNHKVTCGDRFFALMEANGPGLQHIAFGRHLYLGKPSADYLKAVDSAIRLHRYAVSLMRPGATLAEIAVKTRKFANRMGCDLFEHVGWNWMHSMGAYYYEQYALEDYTESIPLEEGILLHCHPLMYRYFPALGEHVREDVMLLNTYLVTADGAQDLVDIPFEPAALY